LHNTTKHQAEAQVSTRSTNRR